VAERKPTTEDAREFVDEAQSRMLDLSVEANRAEWVKSTYITDDTEILAAHADQKMIDANVAYAKQATRFDALALPADLARQLKILKLSLTIATPSDPKESEELTHIVTSMEGAYGKGKYCPPGQDKCLDVEDITRIMAESRDPDQLREVWRGWHAIGAPIRKDFTRYVELANKGARELGFADNGTMWRSGYDMPPDDFAREVDRLWDQVRPLYLSLHAYVRWKLREKYGDRVPGNGPIPADLLGNIWAQSWDNVYPLAAPAGSDRGYDLTAILKARHTDYKQMVRYGEGFFTSLGFPDLPATFWQRSLLTKPADRDVVCHASAWHVDLASDVRLKMCIDITAEDFNTVHHELGHTYYQLAYNRQPLLFRDGANDGFHEAIGDTIALSITPEYLVKLGLLDKAPDASRDIGLLLGKALEKVAFLPFGLLIDKWRWEVFSGEISSDQYNQTWWAMRLKYQGVAPPVPRSETDFDPGAKYHVAANVPYMRYFLADILQFQFHRALSQVAGCSTNGPTPLNRCSIYRNAEAGRRLRAMLEMGKSEPWPDALEALTGQRQMDASAILDYFAPLKQWLDDQNQGKPVGW
jgi:peptidyl-dipeptidase A